MRHSVPHDLEPEQLKEAVRQFAAEYCERFAEYQTTATWLREDLMEVRFKVKGVALSGQLVLLPREIAIEMNVPFPLRLFKGKAVKAIEDQVRPWLLRAKDQT